MITLVQYRALMKDRPRKFTAEDVGFKEKAPKGQEEICASCVHFYQGPVALRNVCEIMRTNPEKSISPVAFCKFWTRDFKTFPLLEKGSGSSVKSLVGETNE